MTRGEHGSGSVAERQVSQRGQVTGAQSLPGKRFLGLVSVCLGFFVIQFDVTIVNVALPARQAGGALGVAILGALFASAQTAGQGATLRLPLTVAAVGYLVAIGLTLAIRTDR